MNDFNSAANERLRFIDLARSIAIVLMLQGHFITLTFVDYKTLLAELRANGSSSSLLFDVWVKLRGFTAPLFFTITGLVFVYLLTKIKHSKQDHFWANHRVKKGLWRAATIVLWGYLIQLNIQHIGLYFKGIGGHEVAAFHILQSIGWGIATLLFLYGLRHLIGRGPLFLYYFLGGVTIFSCYPLLRVMGENQYFPAHAPQFIQNMFHGPKSEFPLFPWLGYVLFGGMLGALVNQFHTQVRKKWFPLVIFLLGFLLLVFGRSWAAVLDTINETSGSSFLYNFQKHAWLYDRLAEVVLLLGFLLLIENFRGIKNTLFLKMGQNTLPIYILHVILLYGALTGLSLKNLLKTNLNGWQSIVGAIAFILLFALFTKYIERINEKISRIKIILKRKG